MLSSRLSLASRSQPVYNERAPKPVNEDKLIHSPRLRRQWQLFEQRQYRTALAQAMLMIEYLQGADLRDGLHLIGMTHYRLGQYDQSADWLGRACHGSEESADWLNLAVAAVLAGRVDQSEDAFAQVRICQQAAKHAQPPGLYRQMLWYAEALTQGNEFDPLWPLMDELASAYRHIRSTDVVSLYVANMPFLSTFLELSQRAWRRAGLASEMRDWLQGLADGLDPEGAGRVMRVIQQLDGSPASGLANKDSNSLRFPVKGL